MRTWYVYEKDINSIYELYEYAIICKFDNDAFRYHSRYGYGVNDGDGDDVGVSSAARINLETTRRALTVFLCLF